MPTGPALRVGDTSLCPLFDGPKPQGRTGHTCRSHRDSAHWWHASRRSQLSSRRNPLRFACAEWNRLRQPHGADRRLSCSPGR